MPFAIDVSCPNGHNAEITMEAPIKSLEVGGTINITNIPCPLCGGAFSAPSGKYEKDENGKMIRVGDYQPK